MDQKLVGIPEVRLGSCTKVDADSW